MTQLSEYNYNGITVKNFSYFLIIANRKYYNYITSLGVSMDLKSKDHQKIYFHFLLIELCEFFKNNTGSNIVFYNNEWDIQSFQRKYISKIVKSFGLKIYSDWTDFEAFTIKLVSFDTKYVEDFDLFLYKDLRPKSFKQIKKFLHKEGFSDLANNYFSDISNKMVILC